MIRWYLLILLALTRAKKKKHDEPVIKYIDLGSQLKYGLDEAEYDLIMDGFSLLPYLFPEWIEQIRNEDKVFDGHVTPYGCEKCKEFARDAIDFFNNWVNQMHFIRFMTSGCWFRYNL